MQELAPLAIEINFNWNQVRSRYLDLADKIQAGQLPVEQLPLWNAGFTRIGLEGGMTSCLNYTAETWHTWMGETLENLVPWTKHLKQQFADAGLDFKNFSYFEHTGNINPHIDSHPMGLDAHQQCNVNYIVASDDAEAKSYFDDGTVWSYPSAVGQAYLMHTGYTHWVTNNNRRAVFQMRFFETPQTVTDYFTNCPLAITH